MILKLTSINILFCVIQNSYNIEVTRLGDDTYEWSQPVRHE